MTSPVDVEIRASLRQNFLFCSLDEADIVALADKVHIVEARAGDNLVRENDIADAVFLVFSGGVNVTKANGQFLAFLGPGGFFGEMALFIEGSHRTANCVASRDTTCIVIRKDVLDGFCNARPTVGLVIYRTIIRTLAERLQATSSDLALLMGSQIQTQASVSKLVEDARRGKRDKG